MKTQQSIFKWGLFIFLMIGLATSLLPDAAVAQTGLDFDGTNDYVTFGLASDLGVQTFTIETWFKREGAGVTTSTGTGGITNGVPLITKGRGEADGNNRDMNFFLGIRSSDNVIGADFEDMATGGNHPVYGVTPITTGIWYHVAVTYDGSKWRLYLNGIFEAELTVNQTPRYDSIQHAGLATALTSTGTAAGYFNGVLDEARIWNYARTQQEIKDNMGLEITSGTGLKGRWGLNEGSGTTANNSVSGGSNGTLTNGPAWVTGSPFALHNALDYGTGTAYVTFGDPSALDLVQFTLETWFKREGTGTTANTGTGGVQAIPLVTKGRGQAEGSNVDMNYFLGIRSSDNVLAADFEDMASGLNHPIIGITVIQNNIWYHVAATYNGSKWQLFLNGNLEAELTVGQTPRWDSIQHAGLATAMNSTGATEGHFDGVLDEARIWNYARTQSEILATINTEITSAQTGLVGRWGLDEGAGTTVYGSAGTTVNGTITNTGYSWVAGAPFNITALPPTAPSDLVATAVSYHQIDLSWTDNADNESNFEIERSSTGSDGPFSLIATVGANTTTYTNTNLLPETQYWYRVRATNGAGNSDYSNVDDATTSAETSYALDFGTGTAYTTFGNTSTLGLAQFTIETWFKREGTGSPASTGTGGFSAIPLVTKGRGEAETPANLNMNYFLGIRSSDNVLCADFEQGSSGTSPGLNHPVIGMTPISNDTWYHAAVTYDGTTWKLYLNGMLETELAVGQPPESNSIQHAGLGTAMNSTGVTEGHLDGVLDEARIWNSARTLSEILSTINSQLSTPQTGLIARWGLNEGSGAMVYGGAGTTVNGNIMNSGYSWVGSAPFNIATEPPAAPSGLTATASAWNQIDLSWTDNSDNESNFEIERSTTGETGPFGLLTTVGANVTTYPDAGLNAETPYWYRVRAINGFGNSAYTNVASATTPAEPNNALDFGGTDAYVNFGTAPSLNTATFTVECWFNRQGAGVDTETGTGGIPSAIPLVAKGAAQAEQSDIDINYFLGINASSGVLVADFEEGTGGSSPSQNHPIYGSTVLSNYTWYHAAVTYDGATWKLYLNGNLDATLAVNQPAASNAINSLAALATSLRSDGTAQGFFDGVIDEVRIWNYARLQAEIQSTINSPITTTQPGLLARWGLNEGSGSSVSGSAGTSVNGTIMGSNWSWTTGTPFNAPTDPPDAAPSDLTAEATVGGEIILEWVDNSTNESNFEIERSTTGDGGPFSLANTIGANLTTWSVDYLDPATQYWYRVRATNGYGNSDYSNVASATTPAELHYAIDFGGTDAYVYFGTATELNAAQFTIETWFKKTGPGATGTTGTSGIDHAIPLIAKGTSESEATAVDINYFLGIDTDNGNVIAADFEEGATGTAPSQNHPVHGVTTIIDGIWYHAAATYDGTTWRLYLNGILEATLTVGQPPALPTTSLTTLATALETDGITHDGYFEGVMDEIHIWNYARTEEQIQSTINSQITTAQTGLIGCWNLNEHTGTTVSGSAGTSTNGTITGSDWSWAAGAPFNITINHAPNAPVLISPSDGATNVATSPNLTVTVSDPDDDNLTVTFYGRVKSSVAQQDFTLVDLPDTQYYSESYPDIFSSQTQWVKDNHSALNIPYVAHVGDIVESGDTSDLEWQRANAAMSILESVLPSPGIPYGIAVGNHDQQPNGTPGGTTKFNEYFGVSRFSGRGYYGGHYGSNNDNHYDLFSASGMDFIVIYLEYDTSPDQAILDWADNLLKTYSTRRGIVVSHNIINTGNPGSFSTQGQAIYNNLNDNSNLFLMLCGHVVGEGRRSDTYNGNTVYTLLADYQGRTNGGDGWLRYMTFKPSENKIYVYTYRPARTGVSESWETDGDSQFTLDYSMAESFAVIGTNNNVPSGSNTSVTWNGLSYNTEYEWYVTVNDGSKTTTGPTWSFTTESAPPPGVLVEAKVFLEGPYDVDTNQMTTAINNQIPTTSPYTEDARTVDSIPANVTDWVLVQLRNTFNGSAIASKSAFLHKDGRIVADDGSSGQITLNASAGDYYIVIKHRNHLAVMSADKVTLSSSTSTLYNFTMAQSQAYGINPMRELETGVFGMRAGDGYSDGGVDALDKNLVWRPQNGTTWEYAKYGDFNLDGGIDALDLNLKWRPNNGTATQVPE